jgi:hypothetical protein
MDCSDHFILFEHSSGRWCAAPPGFRNLLLDPIGLGETRVQAVQELLSHPEFQERARTNEWMRWPQLFDFVEVPEPECAVFAARNPEPVRSTYRAERRGKGLGGQTNPSCVVRP